jgi:hypothetical protein
MLNADTRPDTAFSEAFEHASGFSKAGMTLFLAGHSYFKKGGSLVELHEIISRLVAELNLNDDAGAFDTARESAKMNMPTASSPPVSGRGQHPTAQSRPYVVVPPVREPSAAQIASRDGVKADIAASIFDTFKLRDGRGIGDVRYGELERLETSGLVEAEVLRAIRKRGVAPHDAKVRHIIKPAVLNRIVLKAKEKCRAQ